MKKCIWLSVAALFFCPVLAGAFNGIPGATDRVVAASLIVPFFEVGVNVSENPHDTLLVVVRQYASSSQAIHYHVWDIDGNATDLNGNVNLDGLETWSVSLRDLISVASNATKSQLTVTGGNFYRGFVTIDRVASATSLDPTNSSFPFANTNDIMGWIYYVRILQGSSNGLPMIPLEYVGSSVNSYLRDFYQNSDGREELDADARACASSLLKEETCTGHDEIYEINSRIFVEPSMNGKSRIVVFTWDPDRTQGPSVYCQSAGNCDQTYVYKRYNENGSEVQSTSIRLDHVVNVIDVTGTENGWVSIWDIPVNANSAKFQTYAFSINSASSASISTNWDAILESYIDLGSGASAADTNRRQR